MANLVREKDFFPRGKSPGGTRISALSGHNSVISGLGATSAALFCETRYKDSQSFYLTHRVYSNFHGKSSRICPICSDSVTAVASVGDSDGGVEGELQGGRDASCLGRGVVIRRLIGNSFNTEEEGTI